MVPVVKSTFRLAVGVSSSVATKLPAMVPTLALFSTMVVAATVITGMSLTKVTTG